MGDVTFYILPHDPEIWASINDGGEKLKSDLSVDLNDFSNELRELWPKAKVDLVTNENRREVRWQIPEPGPDSCWGALLYHSIVEIDSRPVDVVLQFVIWYRHYVPLVHRLFMMVPEGHSVIELTQHTSANDIKRTFWMEHF